MDRISQLPDFIVHHILSFLKTPKDLVRMSVLSKTWLPLTASFPILDFSISDFSSGESFFNYVEYTTSRFCHQNLPAHRLQLVKFLRDPADLDIVDRCLERVFRNGVKELVIYLHNYSDYSEPPSDSEESASDYEESPSATAMPRFCGNNLKLSSNSLRTLVLTSDFDLEEIELSTPALGLFIYSCNEHYSGLGISHLPHLELCMRCYLDDSIDTLWFQKLRLFLDKKNGFKALNLYICMDQKLTVLEKLKAVELPPYELEHIELHFEHEESSGHATFVDAVLCCFCPRSLTLRSSFPLTTFEEQSPLVKFTYEKLLEQEFQGQTSIQIVSPYSTKAQKQFKGLMSLPRSLPRQEKAISFIKEEE
ncbi:putative F-box-like domain superfamily protein [Helianthus annuus]|nr:putative F-box-like domain superfamily protein [Helianthus annuus]